MTNSLGACQPPSPKNWPQQPTAQLCAPGGVRHVTTAAEHCHRTQLAAAQPAPAPAPGPSAEEIERAFGAGVERGRAEARAELETIGASFTDSLRELAEFRARLKERYERELLELALGVARKVVQQELAERPEIWLGMIRAAVKRAVDRERIALRVPPPLMAFLRGSLAALRASLQDVKDLELVEDPSLPAGGCVIESRFGEVDIGVETQLQRCERAVRATE